MLWLQQLESCDLYEHQEERLQPLCVQTLYEEWETEQSGECLLFTIMRMTELDQASDNNSDRKAKASKKR